MKKLSLILVLVLTSLSANATHYYSRVVKPQYMTQICFSFTSQNVTSQWEQALILAVERYNNLFANNSNVNFCSSPAGTCPVSFSHHVEITIGDFGENTYWVGKGDHPSWSRKPGDWIKINTQHYQFSQFYSVSSKAALLMHEIGHNLGLNHTGDGTGNIVPGTQGSSIQASLFKAAEYGHAHFPTFSSDDEDALLELYD